MATDQARTHAITQSNLDEFAEISGDDNPIHVDPGYAAGTPFRLPVAHGMFLFSLVRAELRRRWPLAQLTEQRLVFTAPTPAGAVVSVRLATIEDDGRRLRVDTRVVSEDGSVGLQGESVLDRPGVDA